MAESSGDDLGPCGVPLLVGAHDDGSGSDSDLGLRGVPVPAAGANDDGSDTDLEPRGVPVPGATDGSSSDTDLGPRGVQLPPRRGRPPAPRPQQADLVPAPIDTGEETRLVQWLRSHSVDASEVERGLVTALISHEGTRQYTTAEDVENIFAHVLGPTPRAVTSRVAEAAGLDMRVDTLKSHVDHVVSAVHCTSSMMLDTVCNEFSEKIDNGTLKGLAAYMQTVNDETSIRLRPGKEQTQAEVHKLLQSDLVLGLLVTPTSEYKPEMIVLRIPAVLQSMDHNTGETIVKCVQDCWAIPSVQRLLRKCDRLIALTTNDRAGSNLRAEAYFEEHKGETEHRLRTTCDVHKMHTAAGLQLDLQKRVTSGVVNVGISMQGSGGVASLRLALELFFKARARRITTRPPPGPSTAPYELREATLDLYLNDTPADLRRGVIIRRLLNGDWSK